MTSKLFLIAALFGHIQLVAAPIVCNSAKWSLITNSFRDSATLKHEGQQVMFGNLKCETFFPESGPYEGTPVMDCSTAQQVADAGYSVSVFLGREGVGFPGVVHQITFVGSRKLADLDCSI